MAKVKTVYTCQNCGSQSPKWVGRCQNCGEWNTYMEEIQVKETKNPLPSRTGSGSQPQRLTEVDE